MLNRTSLLMLWVSALVATSVLSLAFGYAFGQEALSGVSSPVGVEGVSPQAIRDPRRIALVSEAEVIARTMKLLKSTPTPGPATPVPTATPMAFSNPDPLIPDPVPTGLDPLALSPELAPSPPGATPEAGVAPPSTPNQSAATGNPTLISRAGGDLNLRVLAVRREGEDVVLDVAMQNNSADVARFLYSFLRITDDLGRPIEAVAQGLPGELPPNGQVFQGTVRIPSASLSPASRSVSLNLGEYPNGQRRMEVTNIALP